MGYFQRRSSHFLFGIIQSGLTSGISSAIASIPAGQNGHFLQNWLIAWGIAWLVMLPIVVLAAPFIRNLVNWLTADNP